MELKSTYDCDRLLGALRELAPSVPGLLSQKLTQIFAQMIERHLFAIFWQNEKMKLAFHLNICLTFTVLDDAQSDQFGPYYLNAGPQIYALRR